MLDKSSGCGVGYQSRNVFLKNEVTQNLTLNIKSLTQHVLTMQSTHIRGCNRRRTGHRKRSLIDRSVPENKIIKETCILGRLGPQYDRSVHFFAVHGRLLRFSRQAAAAALILHRE